MHPIATMKHLNLSAATALILGCLSATAGAQSFALDLQTASQWRTVLDGVMGGLSTGRVTMTDEGAVKFTGELSLENNGGFSQMRTAVDRGSFAGATGIVLECRGDGRTYKSDLRVSNARMSAGAFQQEFDTVDGEWTEVRLPFAEFEFYSFGRRIGSAPALDPQRIESVGITLSDKKPGDFRLEIRSIAAFGPNDDKATDKATTAPAGDDLITEAKKAGLTTLLDLVTASKIALPESPVTIFAPTNSAFAKLPASSRKALLEPSSRPLLRQILGLHVVRGAVPASELLGGRRLVTLAGERITSSLADGKLRVGGNATVIQSDIAAKGSLIHLIDTVLMPEQKEPVTAASTPDINEAVAGVYAAAINRGSDLFNAGNTDGCAAIYEVAIESMILLGGNDLGKDVLARLVASRREGAAVTTPRERAWVLRRALDEVYFMVRRAANTPRQQQRNVGSR